MAHEAFEFFTTFISDQEYGGASEAVEVAQNLMTLEPPDADAFANPAAYLEYLKFVVENDMAVALQVDGDVKLISDGADTGKSMSLRELNERNYKILLRDIDKELSRLGGPRASELGDLYERAQALREAAVIV